MIRAILSLVWGVLTIAVVSGSAHAQGAEGLPEPIRYRCFASLVRDTIGESNVDWSAVEEAYVRYLDDVERSRLGPDREIASRLLFPPMPPNADLERELIALEAKSKARLVAADDALLLALAVATREDARQGIPRVRAIVAGWRMGDQLAMPGTPRAEVAVWRAMLDPHVAPSSRDTVLAVVDPGLRRLEMELKALDARDADARIRNRESWMRSQTARTPDSYIAERREMVADARRRASERSEQLETRILELASAVHPDEEEEVLRAYLGGLAVTGVSVVQSRNLVELRALLSSPDVTPEQLASARTIAQEFRAEYVRSLRGLAHEYRAFRDAQDSMQFRLAMSEDAPAGQSFTLGWDQLRAALAPAEVAREASIKRIREVLGVSEGSPFASASRPASDLPPDATAALAAFAGTRPRTIPRPARVLYGPGIPPDRSRNDEQAWIRAPVSRGEIEALAARLALPEELCAVVLELQRDYLERWSGDVQRPSVELGERFTKLRRRKGGEPTPQELGRNTAGELRTLVDRAARLDDELWASIAAVVPDEGKSSVAVWRVSQRLGDPSMIAFREYSNPCLHPTILRAGNIGSACVRASMDEASRTKAEVAIARHADEIIESADALVREELATWGPVHDVSDALPRGARPDLRAALQELRDAISDGAARLEPLMQRRGAAQEAAFEAMRGEISPEAMEALRRQYRHDAYPGIERGVRQQGESLVRASLDAVKDDLARQGGIEAAARRWEQAFDSTTDRIAATDWPQPDDNAYARAQPTVEYNHDVNWLLFRRDEELAMLAEQLRRILPESVRANVSGLPQD